MGARANEDGDGACACEARGSGAAGKGAGGTRSTTLGVLGRGCGEAWFAKGGRLRTVRRLLEGAVILVPASGEPI